MASPTLEIIVKAKDEASGTLKGITESWGGVTSAFQTVGTVALGAAVGGIAALAGATAAGVSLAMEQERVEAQLAAVLESTGHAAGLTADQIKNMASELQGVTTFGDEAILSGQNMLLTFTQIGEDVFPAATEAMLNISTAMGTSLEGAAIQVGKALNNPIQGISALSRVGIQFTDDQKYMIEAMMDMGDVAGAQGVILGELETQFGGSARAAAETFGGRIQQLKNQIGDMGEALGFAFLPVLTKLAEEAMPFLIQSMEKLQPILDAISKTVLILVGDFKYATSQGFDPLGAAIYALQGVADEFGFTEIYEALVLVEGAIREFVTMAQEAIKPIVDFITENVKLQDILIVLGIAIASVVIPALISMVVAAAPVIAVIVAAIAIVALMRTAWENDWGGIQGKVAAVTEWIKETIERIMTGIKTFWENNGDAIKAKAQEIWDAISAAISTAVEWIKTTVDTIMTNVRTFWEENGDAILAKAKEIWDFILGHIENTMELIRTAGEVFGALFKGDWELLGEKLVEFWMQAWTTIKEFLEGFWDLIKPVLENLWESIKGWWSGIDWGQLGRDLISGLISGITNGAAAVSDAISGIATGAINAFKRAMGIDSPSKIFKDFGIDMTRGLSLGIEGGKVDVAHSSVLLGRTAFASTSRGAGQAVSGGNITFAPGSIAVYAAPGMDERRLADKVIDAVNRKLGSQADSRMR